MATARALFAASTDIGCSHKSDVCDDQTVVWQTPFPTEADGVRDDKPKFMPKIVNHPPDRGVFVALIADISGESYERTESAVPTIACTVKLSAGLVDTKSPKVLTAAHSRLESDVHADEPHSCDKTTIVAVVSVAPKSTPSTVKPDVPPDSGRFGRMTRVTVGALNV